MSGGGEEGAPSASVAIISVERAYWGVLEMSHGMGIPDCSCIVSSLMALGGLTPDTNYSYLRPGSRPSLLITNLFNLYLLPILTS